MPRKRKPIELPGNPGDTVFDITIETNPGVTASDSLLDRCDQAAKDDYYAEAGSWLDPPQFTLDAARGVLGAKFQTKAWSAGDAAQNGSHLFGSCVGWFDEVPVGIGIGRILVVACSKD